MQKENKLRWKILVSSAFFIFVVISYNLILYLSDLPNIDLIQEEKLYIRFTNMFEITADTIILLSNFINICISVRVYLLMRKHHNFEFKRTKGTMKNQIFVIVMYFMLLFGNYIYQAIYSYNDLMVEDHSN